SASTPLILTPIRTTFLPLYFLITPPLTTSTLFPYTTLFRSPDDIKGEAIACFVTLKAGQKPTDELKVELREHVANEIGALARPEDRKSTRLNSSNISYAVFCLKKKNKKNQQIQITKTQELPR